MKLSIFVAAFAGMMIAPCALVAQAPAGATGQCQDGTYTTAASKQGACRGHKGVATWYAEAAPTTKSQTVRTAPATAAAAVAAQPKAATGSAGATGQCKDGTYTTAASKQGACRGHQGVAAWYADASSTPKSLAAQAAPVPVATPTPAATPKAATGSAGATGQCKDGTYTTAASKQGACRGHQGVAAWYATATSAPVPVAPVQATPTAAAPAPQPAVQQAPAPVATRSAPAYSPSAPQAKPTPNPVGGGGPGLVWVNTPSNVYHCYGTRFYGTTKSGRYMTEADARAAGARPDHNTPCAK